MNDLYTGAELHGHLISTYKNEDAKAGRHKAGLALLPTVDYVNGGTTEASFRICAWRTNDAKNQPFHQGVHRARKSSNTPATRSPSHR